MRRWRGGAWSERCCGRTREGRRRVKGRVDHRVNGARGEWRGTFPSGARDLLSRGPTPDAAHQTCRVGPSVPLPLAVRGGGVPSGRLRCR